MLPIILAIALLQNSFGKSSKTIASSNSKSSLEARNSQLTEDFKIPSPSEVYDILIGMQSVYPEGKYWTDASSGTYTWKGGRGNYGEIANMGTGCVYFCFHLSDTAFGTLPARLIRPGNFKISDVRTGDLLRTDFNSHSVIVLKVYDQSVVVAEGNYNKAIHWGRILTKSEVENADHLITRYPEGYVAPEDPVASQILGSGSFGANNQLRWSLDGAGYLKISGNGKMPDYNPSDSAIPWSSMVDNVTSVIIESGVTHIGSCTFYGTNIYGITIAGTVKTIGDNAFRSCSKLSSISIPEGTETVGANCFRGCENLQTVTFPSTIKEVGDSALMSSTVKTVKFTPGEIMVKMGNSLFTQCYSLMDLTLPTLMDRISDYMFYSSKMYYLYIPNGVTEIGDYGLQQSFITVLVIPSSVTRFGMTALTYNLQYIYFCGTQAQWNAISKAGNQPFLQGKTIYYVADVQSVKILDNQNNDVQGTTVQMGVGESNTYTLELTFSQGEKIMDPRSVEWFCVPPDTPTNSIKAIESAASAGDVVALKVVSELVDNAYKVTLNVNALKNGNARIVGHVKKNPTSSMATNTDHVYSFVDIKVPGATSNPTSAPTSKPTTAPTSNPTSAPTSKPTTAPTSKPTSAPTSKPTTAPTSKPTSAPTSNPTSVPTSKPTTEPTSNPTTEPTSNPSSVPQEPTSAISSTSIKEDDQSSKGKSKKGLPLGAVIGIAVGIVVVLAAVAVGIFIYLRRKRLYQHSTDDANQVPQENMPDQAPQESPSDPL